ncbi:uncharacterized protein LOC123269057 [Cotesia glomerata]|uniref:uncharacterized protein LOC123269057 n=1 Tax=Cotesia glomerata TaxID=32391 RepID=UPI001D00EC53|nr:uncharacterized protein LOC123269057 [Cotesia glomerata]
MMWKHIATEMSTSYKTVFTAYQCENRLKRVKRDAKEALDNNRISGRAPRVVKYQDELQKISSIDDSFLPKVRFGVGIADIDEPATIKRKSCDSDTTSDDEVGVSKKKKRKTAKRSTTSAIDVIEELAKQNEETQRKTRIYKRRILSQANF